MLLRLVALALLLVPGLAAGQPSGASVYTSRPADTAAVYFTPEGFGFREGDDVSAALQRAVDSVKTTRNYGIVFLPEGTYRVSRTIYVPKAVRLIGYGRRRPEIVLAPHSPGFDRPDPDDRGAGRYVLWFTDRLPEAGRPVPDANAGTFYSALSNVDVRIGPDNPAAIALRTHFAQHSFVSHVDLHIGEGRAGIFDVGNEIEDVRFFGGDYGIYTTKPSPGWPFLMIDTAFEGQRRAAVHTREAGLTVVRMTARRVPVVFETEAGYYEKLYVEDSRFDGVTEAALVVSNEANAHTQVNLRGVACRDVPVLARFRESGRVLEAPARVYRVASLVHGQAVAGAGTRPEAVTTLDAAPLAALPEAPATDLPALPPVAAWTDARTLGAVGDGLADDTRALQDAIDRHPVVYLPSGRYRVSATLRLRPNTVLVGLHPWATQLVVADRTEAFGGFGTPVPLLEAPAGGAPIVSGIGLDTGGSNPRAVACKWMAGPRSYMNDVKFVGGHGGMHRDGSPAPAYNASRTADADPSRRWDSQFWSLWVTAGGGGIFKDVWTASPYAAAGLYVSDTDTPGRVYAMSSEHHVRNEVILRRVSNWRFYALQTEEEVAEGPRCQPLDLVASSRLFFANLYLFRVIWLETPYPYAIRTFGTGEVEFAGVHNFTQVKYTIDHTLLDADTGREVRPWELARLVLPPVGAPAVPAPVAVEADLPGVVAERLATGFSFADGLTVDSHGNAFFIDGPAQRVYRWSPGEQRLTLVTELHHRPRALAVDADDRLLVATEYLPPRGATVGGRPEVYPKPPDAAGTAYGVWYHPATTRLYALDPDGPDASLAVVPLVPTPDTPAAGVTWHPGNRWRDTNDFAEAALRRPPESFLAPDGRTRIPAVYDLLRAVALNPATPGRPFYAADEYNKRTYRFDVAPDGSLAHPQRFAERGEQGVAVAGDGRVVVADGDLYVYDPTGRLLGAVTLPERPATLAFAPDGRTLYVTARTSLYRLRLP